MNVVDENIPVHQRVLLRAWNIPFRRIGYEVGPTGIQDPDIIPSLHRLRRVTFFTRDEGFFRRPLLHANDCLVCLAVDPPDVAAYIRRFLKHPAFRTAAQRMGSVVRVTDTGLRCWRLHEPEREMRWEQ